MLRTLVARVVTVGGLLTVGVRAVGSVVVTGSVVVVGVGGVMTGVMPAVAH
ncbi:hypothetical protein [Nonomuraea sp. NPDC052265]|uniref:hypothetical protein n=1 Tax=Nonomuraea sp. NPDC052265 TaxID=3364374 RepID=UPI0037CCB108